MLEYNDGMGHRGRRAWALLINAGRVFPFTGESIPGVVAVLGHDYSKAGKWSSTTYRLEVAPSARWLDGRDGWNLGTFAEGLASATGSGPIDTWGQMADALGVSVGEARRFLSGWRVGYEPGTGAGPRTVAALDAAEAALAAVDDAADAAGAAGAVEVSVSFGCPRNRQIAAGFWGWPVVVRDAAGVEVGRVAPAAGQFSPDWDSPVCTGPVAVVATEGSAGMHGGYRSLRLAVPEGCTAEHGEPLATVALLECDTAIAARFEGAPMVMDPPLAAPAASAFGGAMAAAFARRGAR